MHSFWRYPVSFGIQAVAIGEMPRGLKAIASYVEQQRDQGVYGQ